MTKEQTQKLWEAIKDLGISAHSAGIHICTEHSGATSRLYRNATRRTKVLLTKYTGHEVE